MEIVLGRIVLGILALALALGALYLAAILVVGASLFVWRLAGAALRHTGFESLSRRSDAGRLRVRAMVDGLMPASVRGRPVSPYEGPPTG